MKKENQPSNPFFEAVANYFRNYFKFTGTTPQKEFWYVVLFRVLFHIVFLLIFTSFPNYSTVHLIEQLFFLIPTLSLTSRRFRDAFGSAWWVLIPVGIVLITTLMFKLDIGNALVLWTTVYWFAGLCNSKNPVQETKTENNVKAQSTNGDLTALIISFEVFINTVGIVSASLLTGIIFTPNNNSAILVFAFGALFIAPILLIIFGIVLAITIIFLVKIEKKLKKSTFSKKKKTSINAGMIINLLAYPVAWIFFISISGSVRQSRWNNHTAKISPQIERNISHEYQKAGFKNFKIKVKDVQGSSSEGSSDLTVNYIYSEKINGKTFKEEDQTTVDDDNYKLTKTVVNKKPERENVSTIFIGDGNNDVTYYAPYKQPKVKKQLNSEKKEFQTICNSHQSIGEVIGDYYGGNFKNIKSQIETNKKANRPVGGYYNLDVEELGAKNSIEYRIELRQKHYWTKKQRKEVLNRIRKLDYSKFWPGKYHVNLNFKYDGYWDSDDYYVLFTVKNGKGSKFKLTN